MNWRHPKLLSLIKVFWRHGLLGIIVLLAAASAAAPQATIADLPLSMPFKARSAWRLAVTQDPSVPDPNAPDAETMPGTIHLCLKAAPASACDPAIAAAPSGGEISGWDAHYLRTAEITGARPWLLLQTASAFSGDGDQAIFTQLLAYNADADRFRPVFSHVTARNNNQETRFFATGPLAGSIVLAEPTQNAPFAFWITVAKPDTDGNFKPRVKFRSATLYGDGNPLSVIDSDMANIGAHLGFWHQGASLPLPPGGCPKPRLIKLELWCK